MVSGEQLHHAPVTLADALAESKGWGYLTKPTNRQQVIQGLHIDGDSKEQLRSISGRISNHLIRLLRDGVTDAERDFAVSYLREAADIWEVRQRPFSFLQRDPALGVLNGEGFDTCMFWTFAPYLRVALRERGYRGSIGRILDWAATGKNSDDGLSLEGLQAWPVRTSQDVYVLSRNPDGASHQFTRIEARRIV